jgi:hypothetical protein
MEETASLSLHPLWSGRSSRATKVVCAGPLHILDDCLTHLSLLIHNTEEDRSRRRWRRRLLSLLGLKTQDL